MEGFMLQVGELFCVTLKRSLNSALPWDIPWYDASHTIFFAALYGVLTIIGLGVLVAILATIKRLKKGDSATQH
jgi:hypothetical protein